MKVNSTKKIFSLFLLLLGLWNISFAQHPNALNNALQFIEEQKEGWQLTPNDISDLGVSDMYSSRHNGVTHVYFIQKYKGIEISNAITSVHIAPDGEAYCNANRFYGNVEERINTTSSKISPINAVKAVLGKNEIERRKSVRVARKISNQEYLIDKADFAKHDVKVKLCYQADKSGDLFLAWDVTLEETNRPHMWSTKVNALTGEVIAQQDWVVHCKFVDDPYHNHDAVCRHQLENTASQTILEQMNTATVAGSYNVFGQFIDGVNVPHESPTHGPLNVLQDPHDVIASPYGWHDVNGEEGAEYTITRGNNVHAYLDLSGNNTIDYEADGGATLNFDYSYDNNVEPDAMQDLAVTNLFYMTNTMHDFAYAYGFNEEAGNFQVNNYGNWIGGDNDPVQAEGQDADGSNNANFGTPPDGGTPRMQMYLWNNAGGRFLTVDEPAAIAGPVESPLAGFGPQSIDVPITAEVVTVNDGSSKPTLGCDPLENDLTGKIALIDRGECFFETKVNNAEAAGAIAAIVCNFEEAAFNMGDSEEDAPSIPSVMISFGSCQLLRAFADGKGLVVTLSSPADNGPTELDGDFDNGIIAHEFGHGISNRLVGGPAAAGCLGNGEQMGEGWSDFFTLATTVRPGDTGEMRRGIGTYVLRQTTDGQGIRRYPYSTDMNINAHTYDVVIQNPAVHPLGEVWTTMLWDLYWAFVDEYGFNIDRTDATAGNNIAVQLVMDGMKYLACSPGFVDGRDAILQADNLAYGGANQCLIWEVFARRGLGYSADQGSSDSGVDGTEAFDPLPTCVKELKITKSGSELVNAGEEIEYTITVINHKDEMATNVVVTDEVPEGCSYVAGSATNGGTESNGVVSWNLGDMATGDEMTLTYSVLTDINNPSVLQFEDDFENGSDNWVSYSLDDDLPNNWIHTNLIPNTNSGEYAYFVSNEVVETDQVLQLFIPYTVEGDNPVIRFYHEYDTEPGVDGGFIEYSTDGELWIDAKDFLFKNPYRGPMQYSTFAIPFLESYWGNSNGFVASYLDISSLSGQDLFIRWRFGSDENGIGAFGWTFDDFAIFDMVNYNGEACVSSDEGDQACVEMAERGTIVEPLMDTAVEDNIDPTIGLSLFPNPTTDLVNIAIRSERSENTNLQLIGADGRVLTEQQMTTNGNVQTTTLDVSNFVSGFYYVRMTTSKGIAIEKLVIQ